MELKCYLNHVKEKKSLCGKCLKLSGFIKADLCRKHHGITLYKVYKRHKLLFNTDSIKRNILIGNIKDGGLQYGHS